MSALKKNAKKDVETSILAFYEATFSSAEAPCPDDYTDIDYSVFHDAVANEFRKVNKTVESFSATIIRLIDHSIDERLGGGRYTQETNSETNSRSNTTESHSSQSERDEMSSPTREEIEARLRATEATVDARLSRFETGLAETLSSMRVDIATLQSSITTQLSTAQNDIKKEISQTAIQVGELKGEIGGIKTVTNWTLAILGLAAAVAAVVVAILQLQGAPTPVSTPQAPIVIQLPPTTLVPPPPPATSPSAPRAPAEPEKVMPTPTPAKPMPSSAK